MSREWTEQEIQLIVDEVKKGQPIHCIADEFNNRFERRTYDSIQKKIKRLRDNGLEYAPVDLKSKDEISEEQESVLSQYVDALKQYGRKPSLAELEEAGLDRLTIQTKWGDIKKLELAARVEHKHLFNEVPLSTLLTPQKRTNIKSMIGQTKKFVVTTAITGCRIDENFLASIDTYCKKNNAELLVLIASDPAHQYASDDSLGNIDGLLEDRYLIGYDTEVNNNLFLSEIKLSAKQIDPSTGMQDLAQKNNSSYIFATPKQRLKFVPVPVNNHPPAIIGTGAITYPNYNTDMYMSRRTGYMADKLHVMGAVVVEVEDEEVFHFRHVQANADGSFVDWGVLYTPKGTKKAKLEALVCGDEHAGRQKPEVINARTFLCKELNPKRIVLHDLFDGRSISHHVEGKTISIALRAQENNDNLYDEFKHVVKALERYKPLCERIVVVKSNHDEHLVRYLEDGRFIKDPRNYRLSLDLAAAIYDGKDPIKVGCELVSNSKFNNITWLKRDQDYEVAGIDLSHHGDRGPNGSRGGIKAFARSVRASITAHSHTAEIYGSAWRVGTSTGKLDYCVGPSSWTNTDCLLYENGSRQMVNYIQGRYKTQ